MKTSPTMKWNDWLFFFFFNESAPDLVSSGLGQYFGDDIFNVGG